MKIVFVHPDLGIGGAERLVVDAALALKSKGHEVSMITAHHDSSHCFPETTNGQLNVQCIGDWLPRTTFGKLAAFWAYFRMIYISIYLVFFSKIDYDIAFVDQVSACIPFLRFKRDSKILFYCHFPDQLLTTRKTLLKRFYRYIIDYVEEVTTKQADCVLVNSKFTAGIFKQTFKSINTNPTVLYPSIDFSKFDIDSDFKLSDVDVNENIDYLFLSLNRYERKKNIGLAITAFKKLSENISEDKRKNMHLIIAGGYDHRVNENIEHYNELISLAEENNIRNQITFLKSPSDEVKVGLLKIATCLMYTPDNEHFGIVPLEAMYSKTPVIAVNSGGPKETIVNNETGYLCNQTAEDFAIAMESFVMGTSSKSFMGESCKSRVLEHFSFNKFSESLDNIVSSLRIKSKDD